MSEIEDSLSHQYHGEATLDLRRKPIQHHLRELVARWPQSAATAFAVFGVVWTTIEVTSYFLKWDFGGWGRLATALAFSASCSLVWTVHQHLHAVPSGFERCSSRVRSIVQVGKPMWELTLAHQLLREAVSSLDEELTGLRAGKVFVAYRWNPEASDYFGWASNRAASVTRMIEVAHPLIVEDLLAAMATDKGIERANGIRAVVERIHDVYRATIEFEVDRMSVMPPEGAQRLHALMEDWSDPVRFSVRRLMAILDELLHMDLKHVERLPEFRIDAVAPESVQLFCDELDRFRLQTGLGSS